MRTHTSTNTRYLTNPRYPNSYTNKSDDNAKWAKDAWYNFHKTAADYPDYPSNYDVKQVTGYYYNTFLKKINCDDCKEDYLKIINENPIRPLSRVDLFIWTVDIHNLVNKKIGKLPTSYEEALKAWNIQVPIGCAGCGMTHPSFNVNCMINNINRDVNQMMMKNNPLYNRYW